MFSRTYIVERDEEDQISPEETLMDSLSDHSMVEFPIGRSVVRTLFFIVGLMLVALGVQAFRLQIVQGAHFATIADQSRFHRYSVPSLRGIIVDSNGAPIAENIPVFDLVAVKLQLPAQNSAELGEINTLLQLPPGTVEEIIKRNNDLGVFPIQKGIPKEIAIRIEAAGISGLYVVPYARRLYPYGAAFAHVIGYTSQITAEEREQHHNYPLNERVGRLGIESFYDEQLRGRAYEALLNPETIRAESPSSGAMLVTNLDADLQLQLVQSIEKVFRSAGVRRGAAIVQDARTGAVRAMVSMPTFDPSLFETSGDPQNSQMLTRILKDNAKPLFNRAVSGLYSPGSTIKPLFALAGLFEGVVTPKTMVFADGTLEVQSEVNPSEYFIFRDWKVHGWTDIRKAIADSVDIYFYELGGGYGDIRGLGIDTIERYLKLFRADKTTGIDLPAEASGIIPSRQKKRETKGDAWYLGDTYNVSIGQGDLHVTPLWINMYIGAIANGGALMQPQIVQNEPKVQGMLPFDAETIRIVREGMRQTVTSGTGKLLSDLTVPVAAKTGTAQVTGRGLNSIFTVYGPYDESFKNPPESQIVMTVLVEQIPQSQSLAMQVARNFLSWYFTK